MIITVGMTFSVPKISLNLDINGCLKEQGCWALGLQTEDKPHLMEQIDAFINL